MIAEFGNGDVRQQTGSGRSLLDDLRWLGGRGHVPAAVVVPAGIGEADVLDHFVMSGDIIHPPADLSADDLTQLAAMPARHFALRQRMFHADVLEVRRQTPAATALLAGPSVRFESGGVVGRLRRRRGLLCVRLASAQVEE
jgi:hypothetical protein